MGREPDQVGSSGEGPTGKVIAAGPDFIAGGKRFPGNKKF